MKHKKARLGSGLFLLSKIFYRFAETKNFFMKYQTKEGAERETSPRLWETIHRHVPGNILIEGAELLTLPSEKKSVKPAKEKDND